MKITVVVQSTLLRQLNWQRKASGLLSLAVTLLTQVVDPSIAHWKLLSAIHSSNRSLLLS